MERAIIFVGKEETEQGSVESYQLLIGRSYISCIYECNGRLDERTRFFEEVSDAFVDKILEERYSFLELGVVNGLKINSQAKPEIIPKLEEALENVFSGKVCTKFRQRRPDAIPAPSRN